MNDYDPDTYEEKPAPGHRYDHLMPPRKSHTVRNRVLLGVLGVALIAGTVAAYFVWLKPAKKTVAPQQTAQTTTPTQPQLSPEDAATPQTYKSTKMNIEVTHRKDWQLKEDETSGTISITSPTISYAVNGVSKQGVFILKLRMGADTTAQSAIHQAKAVQDSETIGYTAPTANQFYYTNLTIGGPGDTASFVIVSSANKFKAGGSLSTFLVTGSTYVIVGGYSSATTAQTELMQFDAVPKAQFTSNVAYTQAVDVIKSLKIY